MEMDKEILDGFIIESREHLNVVEDELLQLEKQRGSPEGDSINKIFRGIHTIKGSAGFLGFENINSLSHVMETLLSMMRAGEIIPNATIIDILLESVDILRSMVDNVDNQHKMDISILVKKLDDLINGQVSNEVRDDLHTMIALTDINGKSTNFRISEFQLKQIINSNQNLFLIEYDLNELRRTRNKSPLTVIRELLVLGNIVDGRLETPIDDFSHSLKDVPLSYFVLFESELNIGQLKPVLDIERIIQIDIGSKGNIEKTVEPMKKIEAPVWEPPIESQPKTDDLPEIKETNSQVLPVEGKSETETNESQQTAQEKSNTVRINIDLLDRLMNLAGELVLVRNQQLNNIDRSNPLLKSITQRLDIVTSQLQELIMLTRMQPIGTILGKYPRFVRELSKKLGKSIELRITGSEVELDRTILENLSDPLTHIIRNSCDHGIETPEERKKAGKSPTGNIEIGIFHEAGQINIEISDDGRGIDSDKIKKKALEKGLRTEDELARMTRKELYSILMQPGFSTAEKISDVSGRGVGLDVVRSNIEKLNGSMELKSTPGKNAIITCKLPLTLAIIPCLIVQVGNDRFAIPQVNLEELVALYDEDAFTRIECAEEREIFRLRDHLLPLVRLEEILANPIPFTMKTRAEITERHRKKRDKLLEQFHQKDGSKIVTVGERTISFAVLKIGRERFGLIIDKVLGTEEIVVKPMHSVLRPLTCYAGATVMGDGRVALILDVEGIAEHSGILSDFDKDSELRNIEKQLQDEKQILVKKILIFKSGKMEQFALDIREVYRIEEIRRDDIEMVGEKEFITITGLSTPIIRLHNHYRVSPNIEKENLFLIIPRKSKHSYGLLISELVDIIEVPVQLDKKSLVEQGILGSSIILGKMTLFPDLEWLSENMDSASYHGNTSINSGRT